MNVQISRIPRGGPLMKAMFSLFVALPLLALHTGEPALARAPGAQAMPAAAPAPRPGTEPGSETPDTLPLGNEMSGACCNGMGGPIEEEAVVVIGHVADPTGGQRYRLAPTDANLEHRYAPRPTPGLNPITLRF